MLAALSLLLGGAVTIGLQTHAQQSSTPTPPTQIQTQSAAVGEQENSATDKDNIQDQKDNGQSESTLEQKDGNKVEDGIEANENIPGGGHQDQAGANVGHQFEGVE